MGTHGRSRARADRGSRPSEFRYQYDVMFLETIELSCLRSLDILDLFLFCFVLFLLDDNVSRLLAKAGTRGTGIVGHQAAATSA